MKKRQPEDQAFDECILQTVTVKKPESIAELITLVQKEFHYSDKEILNRIVTLQNEGKIALKKEPAAVTKPSTYLVSRNALWYWATLAFTAVTATLVLEAPESVSAIADIRIILGTFFVLLMPGYALVRTLFPARRSDAVERMGLSIGLSMALVSLDAFILNFTPWEITLSSIVGTLALLIVILATCAFLNGLRRRVAT